MKKNKKRFSAAALKAGYRSGFEDDTAKYLKEKGINFTYEKERIEWLDVRTRHYTPDFILPNGIIVETKGLWTSEDRTKHLLIREQHPELDVRLCFMNASNKIRKGSKTTYAKYCEQKGIKYCDKTIPKSWLNTKKSTRPVPPVVQVTDDLHT